MIGSSSFMQCCGSVFLKCGSGSDPGGVGIRIRSWRKLESGSYVFIMDILSFFNGCQHTVYSSLQICFFNTIFAFVCCGQIQIHYDIPGYSCNQYLGQIHHPLMNSFYMHLIYNTHFPFFTTKG